MSTPFEPLPREESANITPETPTARAPTSDTSAMQAAAPGALAAEATTPPAAVNTPDNPPWSIPVAFLVWLASIILIVIIPLLFLLPYLWQKRADLATLAEFAVTDKTAIFLQIVAILPAHLLTLGLAWLVITQAGKYPFREMLGWQWDVRFSFWRSALVAVGLLLTGYALVYKYGGPETQLDKLISSSRPTAFATAFIAAATAPLVEEVVYRGVLYSALRKTIGAVGAVLIVLSLFALVHVPQYWPNFGVLYTILLLSAFLTVVRARTGKLLPCFVIHLVFNGIQSIFIVLDPYFKQLVPDKAADPTGLLVALARLFV